MMTIGDITEQEGEDALVTLAAHVPPHIPIGRPLVAKRDGDAVLIVTTEAFWFVHPDRVSRLRYLPRERGELAEWDSGEESGRTIGPVD